MIMKTKFLALACFVLGCLSAKASVTLTLDGGTLGTSNGTPMADGGLLLLVASTTDSSFSSFLDQSASTSVGSFLSGDDLIIGRFSVSSVSAGFSGGYSTVLSGLNLTGNLSSDDALQLYWFPTLTTSSTTLGFGTSYGQYRTDSALDGSSSGWFMPSDSMTVALNFFTQSAGGSEADLLGNASLSTVPEPATTVALLGGVAALFVVVRRRRAQRARTTPLAA
jgi:PEP-CTERM motif